MVNKRPMLPNATAILVLGICSIVPGICCYGIPGIICGAIALSLANKAMKAHNDNPSKYDGFSNVKAGKTCAIIGLAVSSLWFLAIVIYFIVVGSLMFDYMSYF